MAVAVKNASEASSRSPFDPLAVNSLVGLAYVIGSIGIVFYAIPWAWELKSQEIVNSFVDTTLMLLAMLAAAGGTGYLGLRLVHGQPPPGLRAGIFLAGLGLFSICFITWCFGKILESSLPATEAARTLGGVLTAGLGIALLVWCLRKFLQPGWEDTLTALEDQGWFSLSAYKRSQGQRVRRGTVLGILVLAGCGIGTLWNHNTLVYGLPDRNNWYLAIPFADGLYLQLLRDVRFTVPLLLTVVSLWFALRIVNFPTFADFLIATEAELNKVSWTTRRRLMQDTVVVLVTVVLMTVFLLGVDLLWGVLLNKVGVLQGPTASQQEEKRGEQPW